MRYLLFLHKKGKKSRCFHKHHAFLAQIKERNKLPVWTNLAYTSDDLINDVEALPYKIVDYDESQYGNIYRERAIVRERIRLAMGLSLRPENAPVHVTQGLAESNIDEKYYEPPLMQVIPSACNACPENRYEVTDRCMGESPIASRMRSLTMARSL